MPQRRKYLYLANVLLVIAIFSIQAAAQDKNIWNEYRPSIIVAMPVNEKLILFQYNVVIYAPEKKLTTIGTNTAGHYLQAVGQERQGHLVRIVGRDALCMDRQLPHDKQL